MIKCYKLKYDNLIDNYELFMDFALRKSDFFSVITELKKPYSKIPLNCEHDDMLQPLHEQLKHQIVGVQEYGNSRGGNHSVMNIYVSNKFVRQALLSLDICFFSFDGVIPEDICFYKKESIWISTVSHEKYAFMYTDDENDIKFFEENNIGCYYLEEAANVYKLPKKAVEFNGEKYSRGY